MREELWQSLSFYYISILEFLLHFCSKCQFPDIVQANCYANDHQQQEQIVEILSNHVECLLWWPPEQEHISAIGEQKETWFKVGWIKTDLLEVAQGNIVADELVGEYRQQVFVFW